MRYLVALYRCIVVALVLACTYSGWLNGLGRAWIPLETQAAFAMAVVMLWAAAAALLKGIEPPAWLKGFVTLYVLIGALAVWFFYGSAGMMDGLRVWYIPLGLITRILLPGMAFLDFFFFDPHRRFAWHFTLSWMAYLPIYLTFVLVRAAVWPTSGSGIVAGSGPGSSGSPFPYAGIDIKALGWERLTVNAAEYLVVCFALGLALFLIDRILPKRTALSV